MDTGGRSESIREEEARSATMRAKGEERTGTVQVIILVPGLIDARYFGLALMTAFTEFISSCRRRALKLSSLNYPSFSVPGLSSPPCRPPFSPRKLAILLASVVHGISEPLFRLDVCSLICPRGRRTRLEKVPGTTKRTGRERHLLSWLRETVCLRSRNLKKD